MTVTHHQRAIFSINDRKTRYLFVQKLKRKTSKAVLTATLTALKSCKDRLHTITSDNGSEFARHREIAARLGVGFYFADPYSSWQRGANENTNGLIRRHYPEKTDFRKVTASDLSKLAFKLINRPRKCLGYRTPHELFWGLEPHWVEDIPDALID